MSTPSPKLLVGWTTIETLEDARALAEVLVAKKLAVCVQIDSPTQSHFVWEGKPAWATEYRLWVKFLPEHAVDIERHLHAHHPYQVPQWIAVDAHHVGEKYLSWAGETRTN
ncbi:MAG: divalent-cation tolerance protein CutA [Opitutaceae bacterium]|nr:divalent-cation tolerance protein CutA [Opitutaceae bacterium]